MKEGQFLQEVKNLKIHHNKIQQGLQQLASFAPENLHKQAQQQVQEVSSLTLQLHDYCEELLQVWQRDARKCQCLKKRLLKAFQDNKLSVEQGKRYEDRLAEAEKKIRTLQNEKKQLQLINENLKFDLKLNTFVSSFTFKQEKPKGIQPPKLEQSSIGANSSVEQIHETSVNSLSEDDQDIQLYRSVLEQLCLDAPEIKEKQTKAPSSDSIPQESINETKNNEQCPQKE